LIHIQLYQISKPSYFLPYSQTGQVQSRLRMFGQTTDYRAKTDPRPRPLLRTLGPLLRFAIKGGVHPRGLLFEESIGTLLYRERPAESRSKKRSAELLRKF
jgi:hypothetical protein